MTAPDITIPPGALEAAKSAYTAAIYRGNGTASEYHEAMSAACLAMLKAWPGMDIADDDDWCAIRKGWITLPQESSNAEG